MISKAKKVLCELLDLSRENVEAIDIETGSSLASKVENENGSIFGFLDRKSGKKYVVKVKNSGYWKLAGMVANVNKSEEFSNAYNKGYPLFYVKDTYLREKKLYDAAPKAIAKYLPSLIASKVIDDDCFIVLPFYEFDLVAIDTINREAMNFLAKLHSGCRDTLLHQKVTANTFKAKEYSDNKQLFKMFNDSALLFADLPKAVVEDIEGFTSRIEEEFSLMEKSGLTLTHGDFALRNIGLAGGELIVFDWELASVLESMFDIVSYLINYSGFIDTDIVEQSIGYYLESLNKEIDKEAFMKGMKRNLLFYFVTRLSAVILLSKAVPLDYIDSALYNFKFLWSFLSCQ